MAQQELRVNLTGDSSKLNNALTSASSKLASFGSKMQSVGKSLSTKLTLPLTVAGGAAIKFASDFEESMNKVDVAFGNSKKEVKDFAKTTLKEFGIAEGSALDMAALFGDMATSMGLTQGSAANMSTSLVGLAGDLASFKNIGIEQATTALAGVFTGETESLKRLGIVMTEANLKSFAMQKGMQANIKTMTQAEKVALRYRFIMESTTNAQGDFSRTSGGAANQMRIFQESMKQLAAKFGQLILPTFTKLVSFANNLIQKFSELSPTTKKVILIFAGVAAAIGPILLGLGTLLTMAPAIGAAFTIMTGPIGLVIAALTAVAVVIAKNWKPIKKAVIDVANYFIELYNKSALVQIGVNSLIMVFKNAFAIAKFMVKNIITIFKAFANSVMRIFGSIGDIIMGVLTLDIEKIKKGFSGIGSAMSDGFNKAVDGIKANATELGNTVVDNFNDALEKKTIKKLTIESQVASPAEGTTPTKGKKITVSQVIDPDAAAKLKAINDEINKALITNDKLAYNARKKEATKYYDELIKKSSKDAEKQKALQKAKGAALAQIEMDENNRLLDIKNRIADSTNTTDAERKALEIANIKSHYATLLQLATENGLETTELLAAQADAIKLVNDEKRAQALQDATDFNKGLNQIVTSGLNDLAVGIGQALGKALSEGGNLTQQLSKIVLTTVGNMAMQLGKLAIAIGIGVGKIKEALLSLNPAVAIAAGIALVALGSFASSQAAKIATGGGGATAFANGGIVSGPTMGLVGEYPGARSNPEVIAPLNKLQNIIGNTGGSQNITVGGQIRLDGQDLLIAIERANETAERIF